MRKQENCTSVLEFLIFYLKLPLCKTVVEAQTLPVSLSEKVITAKTHG